MIREWLRDWWMLLIPIALLVFLIFMSFMDIGHYNERVVTPEGKSGVVVESTGTRRTVRLYEDGKYYTTQFNASELTPAPEKQ